jgi:hypothetical protein
MVGNVMAGKTLTIVLAADISRLSKGLRSAQGDLNGFDGSVSSLGRTISNNLGPSLLVGAAAAGAFAIKLGVDGVKAALEDQQSLEKLNTTLQNVGFGSAANSVDEFISSLQMANGIADDVLRPSLSRLLIATHDLQTSQAGLSLALDISAGTGKSLEAVTNALGKAYEGNYGALGKLGTGIDKATLQSGDMQKITTALANNFEGQAATAAATYQGKIDRLSQSANEAQETIGYALVNAVDRLSGTLGGADGAQTQIENFGNTIADLITGGSIFVDWLTSTPAELDNFSESTNEAATSTSNWTLGILQSIPIIGSYAAALVGLGASTNEAAIYTQNLANAAGQTSGAALQKAEEVTRKYGKAVGEVLPPVTTLTGAIKINTEALDAQNKALDASLDKLNTQNDALKTAGQAYADYYQNLSGQITSGIDLGAAFAQSLETGQPLTEALGAQISSADWYGTILRELKASNASQGLIDAITAEGPIAGAKLGETIILEGLIPTLNAQLEQVKASADLTAKAMVPAFLIEGQNAAIGFVQEAATQVLKDQEKLVKIGKNIGKPIALQAAAEIAAVLAKTFKDIEAAKTAADAAAASAAASRRVLVSDQQAIQQLNQILANGNARAGYQDTVVIA